MPTSNDTTVTGEGHAPPPGLGSRVGTWARRNRVDLVAVLVIIAGSFMVVGLHVKAYTKISPIDELSHIDGIVKWGQLDVIQVGERVGQVAMREEACRGLDREDRIAPCTRRRFNPNDFQDLGHSYSVDSLPVYYVTTGVAARVIQATGLVDSIVTAGRLLGALWLAAALVCIWFIGKELGCAPLATAIGISLIAVTPLTLHASAVINPDATLLLGGAATLWMALRWERGASPWWLFALVAALAVLMKSNVLLMIGLVAVFLGARALARRADARRLLLGAGAVVAVAVVLAIVLPNLWQHAVGTTSTLGPRATTHQIEALRPQSEVGVGAPTIDQVWAQLDTLFTPLRNAYRPAFLAKWPVTVGLRLTDWLLIVAVGGVLVAAARRSVPVALAAATGLLMLSGPLAELDIYRKYHVNFAVNARYGLPIVPALAVLAAWCASQRRSMLFVSGGLAVLCAGAFGWASMTN